ncbi:hypothetical protein Acr_26g0001460 [Actinidia rufa]|uniref:Uncharacterized protein n=1 Tax=Actinidia rufa TaxID=165716 RepID=A0A7J0H1C3_9ERIC|nr:hypothetical protein Acr_26g0001460 [Actinidia rufa]
MAEISNQNVIVFLREGISADYGAIGFLIVVVAAIAVLYRTDGGKKHLYSLPLLGVSFFAFAVLFALYMALLHWERIRWRDRILHRGFLFYSQTSSTTPERFETCGFFYRRAINTTVVKFSLGLWTGIVLACCIETVHLRNEFEQRVTIPAVAIEMRSDEDVELGIHIL